MSLLDICNEHLSKGQQGQLVLKFTNDVHLCKILVCDGEAVHISHGRTSPETILENLAAKTIEWVNFIANYPVRKRLEMPLHQMLLQTAKEQQGDASHPADKPAAANATPVPSQEMVSTSQVQVAIDTLIDRIGPLGTVLAENIMASLNYTAGTPMPRAVYERFVAALGEELPVEARAAFVSRFHLAR